MVRLFAIIALLLAGAPASTAAQAPPDLAARFAEDAAQHVRDLNDLYSKRGVTAPKLERATLADVQAYLATQRDDNSPGYPEGAAVLFYAHHDDRLAIYLIDRTGLRAIHETTLTPTALQLSANNYRIDLEVDGLARSRAPQWIGDGAPSAPPVTTSSKASGQTPIADVLLPPAIRTALLDVRHLVIVANGVIASTPFAALPLTGEEVLIDRMSITVSAGLFDLDQMIRPWAGLDEYLALLVVGDPRDHVREVERGEDYLKQKFEAALEDDTLAPESRSVVERAYQSVKDIEYVVTFGSWIRSAAGQASSMSVKRTWPLIRAMNSTAIGASSGFLAASSISALMSPKPTSLHRAPMSATWLYSRSSSSRIARICLAARETVAPQASSTRASRCRPRPVRRAPRTPHRRRRTRRRSAASSSR